MNERPSSQQAVFDLLVFFDEKGERYRVQENAELGRGVLTCVAAARREGPSGSSSSFLLLSGAGSLAGASDLAVKTVLPLWIGHPLAEARIARERELSIAIHAKDEVHPCCAHVLAGGRQAIDERRSRPFHVSPRLSGCTLSERLREPARARALCIKETLAWADDLLSALIRLHAIGWVHRDIKPQNVFLLAERRAVLIDFGLAVQIGSRRVDNDEPFGTPAYVSPEVIAGETLDGRADLYSLGLLLFEALASRRPFPGRDPVQLLDAHLSEAAPPLRQICADISPSLEQLVAATLRKPPGERPASAIELQRLLRATPEARTSYPPG